RLDHGEPKRRKSSMKVSSVMSGPDSARKPGPTLTAVNGVQLLVSLDLCIVNVALPDIAAGLGFESSELSWVIHAYALTFGGLLLLGGKVADLLGHRRVRSEEHTSELQSREN